MSDSRSPDRSPVALELGVQSAGVPGGADREVTGGGGAKGLPADGGIGLEAGAFLGEGRGVGGGAGFGGQCQAGGSPGAGGGEGGAGRRRFFPHPGGGP